MRLNKIYEPVQEDLVRVEDMLKAVSRVDAPGLSKLLDYSLKGNGKAIRPALVLLVGRFYDYNLDCLVPMATAVELYHTATLVHDDAIDNSPVRRGRPTINEIWDKERAILLGDYLFAKGGELTSTTGNLQAVKLASQTLMTISSGELNQAINAFNLKQTHQHYFQRIASKTASLFTLATETGAILSQAPEKSVQILKEYGHNLGIAFQIVDDILDFIGSEEELGKPVGSDLIQGTLTLPAMLLLERYPEENPVKSLFLDRDKEENARLAIESIRSSSIVPECYKIASDYCSKACHNLKLLPASESKRALTELADYITSRRE